MDNDRNLQNRVATGAKQKLHRFVAEVLRSQLIKGSLTAGTKLPTLRELSKKFDVSTMTIRLAIRDLEKEGHIYHIPSVGTFVRHTIRTKKTPGEKTVSFSAVNLSSSIEMEIAHGVEEACHDRGWAIQMFDSHFDLANENRNLQRLIESDSQGAIIFHSGLAENIEKLFKLKAVKFPFVLVDRSIPGLNVDLVESDHEQGAYLATKYLLEQRHSKILILASLPTILPLQLRVHGYERALAEAVLKPQQDWKVWVNPEFDLAGHRENRRWYGAYKTILPILKKFTPPLAVFALDNNIGWGVYQACQELNLKIPEDVSVICFDDSDIAQAMIPPMTAIAQRTNDIGRIAVELLDRRLQPVDTKSDSVQTFKHVVVDVKLVERYSVTSPAFPQKSA